MLIQMIETPNPNTMKFYVGREVNNGDPIEIFANQSSAKPEFIKEIFSVGGVKSIFYGRDFVSVTKSELIDWHQIKADIIKLLMKEFSESGLFANNYDDMEGSLSPKKARWSKEEKEVVDRIEKLLKDYVVPRLEEDGGFVKLVNYYEGIVYLNLQGACASCPHAFMTLKQGIRGLLSAHIEEVIDVVGVDAEGNILDLGYDDDSAIAS